MKNDPSVKALMVMAIASTAQRIQKEHDATHKLAEAATLAGEETVAEAMMALCEHFHSIDEIMKRTAMGLVEQFEEKAPNEDMMSDIEFSRAMGFTN